MSKTNIAFGVLVAVVLCPAVGQIGNPQPGTYPPGTYPPNTYPDNYPTNRIPARLPGGGTIGIPVPEIKLPRRGKDKEENKGKGKESAGKTAPQAPATAPQQILRAVSGTLRLLGDKELLLEAQKHGVLRFRVLAKTQFRDAKGEPMRDSLLKPGDSISVRFNPIDEETILFVHLIKAGTPAERAAGAKPVSPDAIKVPENLEAEEVSVPVEMASARADNFPMEAPPVLRRRAPSPDGLDEAVLPKSDAVIEAAREQAAGLNQLLPNFIVQQHTTRSIGTPTGGWHARDIVTAEVAYVNGAEEYRDVRVNGSRTETPQDTGSWSRGEFAATLQDVLSRVTGAAFTRESEVAAGRRTLAIYSLVVPQSRSNWTVIAPDRTRASPGYRGTIQIDKNTGHVMRIEKHSTSLPSDFPFATAAWIVEYDAVQVDGGYHMLPVRAENWACSRESGQCTRNEISFVNYRKFGADSQITFEKFRPSLLD